jgi:hypothetical protein
LIKKLHISQCLLNSEPEIVIMTADMLNQTLYEDLSKDKNNMLAIIKASSIYGIK